MNVGGVWGVVTVLAVDAVDGAEDLAAAAGVLGFGEGEALAVEGVAGEVGAGYAVLADVLCGGDEDDCGYNKTPCCEGHYDVKCMVM